MFQTLQVVANPSGSGIPPGRAVRLINDGGNTGVAVADVADGTAGHRTVGVSAMFTRRPQGFTNSDLAAAPGEMCPIVTPGGIAEILTVDAVTAGTILYADNNGRATTTGGASHKTIVGIALHAARPNNYVKILVLCDQIP